MHKTKKIVDTFSEYSKSAAKLPINLSEGVSIMKKKKEFRLEDKLKYEIAQELGLYDKVVREGWKSLSARETGKIGGMITKKKRELKKKEEKSYESIDEGQS